MSATVYVLGAGASRCAKAPLMADFQEKAAEIPRTPDSWSADAEGKAKRKLFKETMKRWERLGDYNIEEFYVLADLHERLGLSAIEVHGRSFQLAEGVGYVIFKTLDYRMGREVSQRHSDFVRATAGRGSAVITLNWDIALDRAAETVASLSYAYKKAFYLNEEGRIPLDGSYRVLKLHGSANWWSCVKHDCQRLWVDTGGKSPPRIRLWEEVRHCQECGGSLIPAMVPPVSQKMERGAELVPILSEIWREARSLLSKCDWLVIAGYSFPPTDIQFKMFVIEALRQNKKLKGLTVVSNAKAGSEKTRFEGHQRQIVKGLGREVETCFVYSGFENWVSDDCPLTVT